MRLSKEPAKYTPRHRLYPQENFGKLVTDMTWQKNAACAKVEIDSEENIFYPEFENRDTSRAAKEICRGCPVRVDCLNYALAIKEPFGIWGGMTTLERNRLTKSRRDQ